MYQHIQRERLDAGLCPDAPALAPAVGARPGPTAQARSKLHLVPGLMPGAQGPAAGADVLDGEAAADAGVNTTYLLAHGTDAETSFVADRPITYWTQPDVGITNNLSRHIAGEDPRLAEAWSAWSDHVHDGGTIGDFQPEGLLSYLDDVFLLEGAHSVLPGNPIQDRKLLPPDHASWDPDAESRPEFLDKWSEMARWIREDATDRPLHLTAPNQKALLSELLPGIPGKEPLSVLACRGESQRPR